MGKPLRRGEEAAQREAYERLGIPIYATLSGEARAEAGDMLWMDESTLAVGMGFRTNAEAVRQLREALHPIGVSVLAYDPAVFRGRRHACICSR